MCGISGIIYKNQRPVSEEIKQMNDKIIHRGPDGEGFYEGESFLFGHRRLAIIDVESGLQPMTYNDRYTITYNGEIFNYIELREILKDKGYKFKTDSDTEVVLASYDFWKEECLNKFNGMWSFAIYDNEQKEIFCARDRYSIKPFVYSDTESRFIFGSEYKQIREVDKSQCDIDIDATAIFLSKGKLNQGSGTLVKNVYELPGGHFLKYSLKDHSYKVHCWYDISKIEKNTDISFDEAKEKFYELFTTSLDLRMRSDVPVGALLSGGLDSSSIICGLFDKGQELTTLSSCFEDKRFDEREYIEAVVKRTGFNNAKSFPDVKSWFNFKDLEGFILSQDQPVTGLSHLAESNIYKEVSRNKLKVVLDGQGSDEYLAGYKSFFPAMYSGQLNRFEWGSLLKEVYARSQKHKAPELLSIKEILNQKVPVFAKDLIKVLQGRSNIPDWMNKEVFVDERKIKEESQQKYFSSIFDLSKYELKKSIPYLVHSADRSSMSQSVESRLPFLDYRLLEFTLSLPDSFKIKNGVTKYILRESMRKSLPESVYSRHNKMGFVTPEDQFFSENKETIADYLKFACQESNGLIKNGIVDTYLANSNKPGIARKYFRTIAFGVWAHSLKK